MDSIVADQAQTSVQQHEHAVAAVAGANQNSWILPIVDQEVTVGEQLSIVAGPVESNSTEVLTYGLTGDAPDGARVDSLTGEVTWTPVESQADRDYLMGIIATDGIGTSSASTFNVRVVQSVTGSSTLDTPAADDVLSVDSRTDITGPTISGGATNNELQPVTQKQSHTDVLAILKARVDREIASAAKAIYQNVPSTVSTFNPTDDALVKSAWADRSYGDQNHIRLRDHASGYRSYVKFDVNGIAEPVTRATLRLYVVDPSRDGGTVYSVSNMHQGTNTAWTQNELTWNNAPLLPSTYLDSVGEVFDGTWVEFDVTAAVSGNGTHSFGLSSASGNSVIYSSAEGNCPPQLVIESDVLPSPAFTSSATFRIPENTTSVGTVIVDDPSATLVLKGGANRDLFTLTDNNDGTATLVFTTAPDFKPPGDSSNAYVVEIVATDASANVSTQTITVNVSDVIEDGLATVSTFNPSDDALVKSAWADRSYGDQNHIRLRDHASGYRSYVKFDVNGIDEPVTRATLRLYVVDPSRDGGTVYSVSNMHQGTNTAWTQDELTWNNAPLLPSTYLDSVGEVFEGTWVEFDVTAAVSGNGTHSFGLSSASGNSAMYSSTEGRFPPQLVILSSANPTVVQAQLSGRNVIA